MFIAFMYLLASTTNCGIEPHPSHSYTSEIIHDYEKRTIKLSVDGSDLECSRIEVQKPDGARYILEQPSSAVEGNLSWRLNELPGLFTQAGDYEVSFWPKDRQPGLQRPFHIEKLEWQFPECTLLPNIMNSWRVYLERFEGPLSKTRTGYKKRIEGEGYEGFNVEMSTCSTASLRIEITNLESAYKHQPLDTAISILSQVDQELVHSNTEKILSLDENNTSLFAESENFKTLSATLMRAEDGRYNPVFLLSAFSLVFGFLLRYKRPFWS